MKKFTYSLALFLVMSASVFATDRAKPAADAQTRASQITRMMVDELRLNEAEYIRLRTLNVDRLLQVEEVAFLYKNDLLIKDTKLKEVEENFDRQLQAVLSASQMKAYVAFKQNPPVNYAAFISEEVGISKK
jgi:hypothetical protein